MFLKSIGAPTVRQLWIAAAAVAAVLLADSAIHLALAQGTPFGAPKGAPPAAPASGIVGWIMVKQAEFYKGLSGAIRAAKLDGSAVWGLFTLSFFYGVFHAAGPGHGKAVISSYVVANEETWRRGVVLSFASALLQALAAVAIVGIAAVLLRATAATMRNAVYWIEVVSYALIIAIGLRLIWVKGRAMIAALCALRRPAGAAVAASTGSHAHRAHHHAHHSHDHAHHDHGHAHHGHDHGHDVHHDHHHDDDASAWGHAHAPEPQELAGPGGWSRGFSAVVAVGLRPCSGAILVLVFALAQGLFWAGVVATFLMGLGTAITVAVIATMAVGAKAWAARFASGRAGYGMVMMRGIEVAAALLITAFGVLLLIGYIASERMFGA